MELTDEDLREMYRLMVTIRRFEEKTYELHRQGRLQGSFHPAIGQEAIPVATCAALRKDDYVISTHRGHHDAIAKGIDIRTAMAELFGKATGCCRGKGGSMHFADFGVGFLGGMGIVGAGLPIATGAGLSAKLRGSDQVAVAFFGEGAVGQGVFHESLNLASLWTLPVVYACQNNQYAMSTPLRSLQRRSDVAGWARGYVMPGVTVDGNDVFAVYEAAAEAIERARSGKGPSLIECLTYRWLGHHFGDKGGYRPEEEVAWHKEEDPIRRLKNRLLKAERFSRDDLERIEEEAKEAVEEAVHFAEASPDPAPESALEDVFATAKSVFV